MADNPITSRPSKVQYLGSPVLTFSGQHDAQVTVKWKNPASNNKSTSSSRAEDIGVIWTITCYPSNMSRTYSYSLGSGSATSDTLDLGPDGVWTGVGTDFLYPTGKAHINSISVVVHPFNSVGVATDAKSTTTYGQPAAPTLGTVDLGQVELSSDNGHISCEVTAPEQLDLAPHKDVRYRITTYDSKYPKNANYSRSVTDALSDSTIQIDVPEYMLFASDNSRYNKVTFSAWTRGYRKDSETASRVVYVSRPKVPTITGMVVPSSATTDKVTVTLNLNATEAHPTTGCRLQVLRDVTYTKAEDIPAVLPQGEAWEDGDIQDDGECTALVIPVEDCVPEVDKITWVRVKVWNLDEDVLTNWSAPSRLRKLETESPTAEDDKCVLDPLERDGNESILLHCFWGKGYNPSTPTVNPENKDDSTGTEITWSDDSYAWASTKQPDSFQTDRNDGYVSRMSGTGTAENFQGHIDFYIRDLEPGTKYWVKCRRYLDGDTTTYGPWSAKRSILVGTPPRSIVLSVPAQVATGKSMQFSFSIDANDEVRQKSQWTLLANPKRYHLNGSGTTLSGVQVKKGTGGTAGTVAWADIERNIVSQGGYKYVDFMIYAGWGGTTVESEVFRVYIMDPPKVKPVSATITSQPASFVVKASEKSEITITAVVKARGCTGIDEVLLSDQEPGDCIWSAVLNGITNWEDNTDVSDREEYPVKSTIEMDDLVDFRDGAKYDVYCSASYVLPTPNTEKTGVNLGQGEAIVGTARRGTLTVEWARQAPEPEDFTITASDTVDNGVRVRKAQIVVHEFSGYTAGDKYEIFRVTPDGPQLVKVIPSANSTSAHPLNATITDKYAPFGEGTHAYRVCTVTSDGDRMWLDAEYEFDCADMQIDFDGLSVNLPYNVGMSDSFTKDFESRAHIDAPKPEGYWNESVSRVSNLNTGIIRVKDERRAVLLRKLAQHTGSCFVRLPNGCAFEADVQVNELSEDRMGNYGINVSLTATEVSSTGAFYER